MATMRALARTVDLLGRQQVATVQNAFVELFKNAYDAGATRVQVDYLREYYKDGSGLISIRDNGRGMSVDDFTDKWFVVGTDNKAIAKNKRDVTGEKGIGRLSIALLGRIVLVISRPAADLDHFVVSLVHWGLFELRGIELGRLEFPVVRLKSSILLTDDIVGQIRDELLKNIGGLDILDEDKESYEQIRQDIREFKLSPQEIVEYFGRSMDGWPIEFGPNSTGTWFIVGRPSEIYLTTLREEETGGRTRRNAGFRGMLQAFTDKPFSGHDRKFVTSFKIWENNAFAGNELIGEDSFLSREELCNKLDYFVDGRVDACGEFVGTLRTFGEGVREIEVSAPSGLGDVICGPFGFSLGALHWQRELSPLNRQSAEEYNLERKKLEDIGGVYVYRDGIRVLPYGAQLGGDWLEIDKHRVHALGRFYLSKRNVLGAVMLTRKQNAQLQEKAGREGFQRNLAYRQLREIVLNIIRTISKTYLSLDGDELENYRVQQEELRSKNRVMLMLQRESAVRLERLVAQLREFFSKYDANDARVEVDACVETFLRKMNEHRTHTSAGGFIVNSLQRLRKEVYDSLDKIHAKYVLPEPMGIAMPRDVGIMWERHVNCIRQLEEDVFLPARRRIEDIFDGNIRGLAEMGGRPFLRDSMMVSLRAGREFLEKERGRTLESMMRFERAVKEIIAAVDGRAHEIFEEGRKRAEQLMVNGGAEMVSRDLVEWEQSVFNDNKRCSLSYSVLQETFGKLETLITVAHDGNVPDVFRVLQQALEDLQERANEDFDMVQKGVAVAIVEHEFMVAAEQVRIALKELESLAKQAPAIEPLTGRIRTGFAHLDSFIQIMDPLQGRIHGRDEEISGTQMRAYLWRVFGMRFERENVELRTLKAFEVLKVHMPPSSLYPVLINLVDNALYWLGNVTGRRRVVLDAADGCIFISNNGPAIADEVKKIIFARGFSLKPGGRGLGLFIAREVLRAVGYILEVVPSRNDCSVTFSISKIGKRSRSGADEIK